MRPGQGFVALLGGSLSIAIGVIAAKDGFANGVDPDSMLATRMVLAAPFLIVALLIFRRWLKPVSAPVGLAAFASGVLLWLSCRGEFEALARLPAGTVVLILSTAPAWVAATFWVSRRVAPSRFEVISIISIIVGVAIMAAPLGGGLDPVGLLGGLFSALCFAVLLTVLDRLSIPAVQVFALGALGGATLAVLTDPGGVAELGEGMSLPIAALIGLTYAIWALCVGTGVGLAGPVTSAMVVAIEPVIVVLLAYFILGESMSLREILGGAVVVSTVALAGSRLSDPRSRKPGSTVPPPEPSDRRSPTARGGRG